MLDAEVMPRYAGRAERPDSLNLAKAFLYSIWICAVLDSLSGAEASLAQKRWI